MRVVTRLTGSDCDPVFVFNRVRVVTLAGRIAHARELVFNRVRVVTPRVFRQPELSLVFNRVRIVTPKKSSRHMGCCTKSSKSNRVGGVQLHRPKNGTGKAEKSTKLSDIE